MHNCGCNCCPRNARSASKNQNPREGIEICNLLPLLQLVPFLLPSKNQNPREGIEILHVPLTPTTRRPQRRFKKPKSPRGD